MSVSCDVTITTPTEPHDRVALRFQVVPKVGERIRVPSRPCLYRVDQVFHAGRSGDDTAHEPGIHLMVSKVEGSDDVDRL